MAKTTYEERKAARRGRSIVSAFLGAVYTPRVRAILRVGAYATTVFVVTGGIAANSALGKMSEQALITGRQLSKLEDFTGSSTRLMLNGEKLNIASATTTAPLDAVLDRVEAVCKEEGAMARDFREIDALMKDEELLTAAKKGNFGVLREVRDNEGFVACAVRGPESKHKNVFEGMMKFAETSDLADIGQLRYVYARKTQSGRTHVLTVWTDGSFKLDALTAPADGEDAPGSDPAGAPRPQKAVRYLSAAAEGAPHAVRVYESKAPARDVLAQYETEMPRRGWEAIKVEEEAPEARYYSRGGVDLMVVAYQDGDRTAVSMIETRGN